MTEHVHHDDAAHHDPAAHHGGHHDDPESIAAEKRKYIIVFVMLGLLTGLTVWVTRLDVSRGMAIAIALLIATVKGSLVAAFFMHLLSERKLVYSVLIVTVIFFGILLWGPWHHVYEAVGHHHNNPPSAQGQTQQSAPHPAPGH